MNHATESIKATAVRLYNTVTFAKFSHYAHKSISVYAFTMCKSYRLICWQNVIHIYGYNLDPYVHWIKVWMEEQVEIEFIYSSPLQTLFNIWKLWVNGIGMDETEAAKEGGG